MNLATLTYLTQFGRLFPLAANSKKPRRNWNWKTTNTDHVDILNEWLMAYPKANWALLPVRAFVVDVDVKNGAKGPASIEDAGGLHETMTVRSPSGGCHYYFRLDQDMAMRSKNNFMPGVDIRCGSEQFIVVPHCKTKDGSYEVVLDMDELPSVPEWLRTRWTDWCNENPVPDGPSRLDGSQSPPWNPPVLYEECNSDWEGIRPCVRYLFFRKDKKDNARVWKKLPVKTMEDRSQSGYEYQLARRLYHVGATDGEIIIAYRVWCGKHGLKRKDRFYESVMPTAKEHAAAYVEQWNANHRAIEDKRRKRGTTTAEILTAIRQGFTMPKAIEKATGLKGSAVRVHLMRLVRNGELVRTAAEYAIAGDCVAVDESLSA